MVLKDSIEGYMQKKKIHKENSATVTVVQIDPCLEGKIGDGRGRGPAVVLIIPLGGRLFSDVNAGLCKRCSKQAGSKDIDREGNNQHHPGGEHVQSDKRSAPNEGVLVIF
jgi:hypothetical protein